MAQVTTHQSEEDARNESVKIWVDGALKPRSEAVVSVFDSGFMLGDGVWEGLRLYNGRWAFLDEHMDRLFEAAKAIDLDIGRSRDEVVAALEETRSSNGMTTDAHARLMITRGVKVRPFQHPALSRSGPTMVIIMEHSRPSLPRRLQNPGHSLPLMSMYGIGCLAWRDNPSVHERPVPKAEPFADNVACIPHESLVHGEIAPDTQTHRLPLASTIAVVLVDLHALLQ